MYFYIYTDGSEIYGIFVNHKDSGPKPDFAKNLKGKLNALHDSKWSMTDLYNVLILAHAMKSDDEDERGNKVDYSSISKCSL